MFTFSLSSLVAPFERAANKNIGALTLLVEEPPKIAKEKTYRGKRARLSKFYKHLTLGVFGDNHERYLIEHKDGRFYFAILTNSKKGSVVHHDFYPEFRRLIKSGEWIETTVEKEKAATN